MSPSLDTRKEINPMLEISTSDIEASNGFPKIACEWVLRSYLFGKHDLKMMVPCQPDNLLDDSEIRAANSNDDYMPYWAYLWPAALRMANTVMNARWPNDTRILEMGCGLGLVGIAALAAGYRVSLTDYDATAVMAARNNAELNGLTNFEAFLLDWRHPPAGKYPVILGCDVTYEQRNHVPILDLVESTLQRDGICWLADGGRAVSPDFWSLATRRGFKVVIRNADGIEISKPGLSYQLFELRF